MNFYENRHALVTGASTGLGAAFAQELAVRGCTRLTLVARSQQNLEALATRLRKDHPVEVQVVPQDLAQAGAAAAVVKRLETAQPVDVLVNNAGFGSCGRFDEQDIANQLSEIQLNIAAVVDMSHAFLPGMRARGFGGILNVASIAAFQPTPYMATYAASKSFILSWTEALWAETQGSGVHVTALCPGPTETRFFARMGHTLPERLGKNVPPEPVVRDGLDALSQGRSSKVSGLRNYFLTQFPRIVPRQLMATLSERLMAPRRDAAKQLAAEPPKLAVEKQRRQV